MYEDLNKLSGPAYRTQFYTDSDATYTNKYYCDARPATELDEFGRRIRRVRYLKSDNSFYDSCFAINIIDSKRSDYNLGTADFIFKATDLAYVAALSYNDN